MLVVADRGTQEHRVVPRVPPSATARHLRSVSTRAVISPSAVTRSAEWPSGAAIQMAPEPEFISSDEGDDDSEQAS
jgi:hypothetical protein